jgi:hypothetical protein
MTAQRLLLGILVTVLLAPLNGSGILSTITNDRKPLPAVSPRQTQNLSEKAVKLPPGVSSAWWADVQNNIRRAEYHVTWQEKTYLPDLPASYQAPNRANNLRTYFTPKKTVIIPRVWEKQVTAPPWSLEIGQASLVPERTRQVSASAAPLVEENKIEYAVRDLASWYRNEESGLQQGFTIGSPGKDRDRRPSPAAIRLEMAVGGGLTPRATLNERIIEFIGRDEKPVLRYGSLTAEDAKGRKLRARIMLAGPLVAVKIDAAEAVFPVKVQATISALPGAASWYLISGNAESKLGARVATAGDVNGDGFSDILIGAPEHDGGLADQGLVYVYYGSASGLGAVGDPALTKFGGQAGAQFGAALGTAGDVNGDGYADIIVGAPYWNDGQDDEGGVWVYHGSAAGVISAPAFYKQSDQAGARFGSAVSTAGDVNGDGYSDIIVGAPYWHDWSSVQDDEGGVWVYHGSAAGVISAPAWYKQSDRADSWFGWSVGTAGDVNGDGYADVIVGAPNWDDGQVNEGGAWVYHGSAAGVIAVPAWYKPSDQVEAWFGWSVGTAGDVNGDGYADIIVGAPYWNDGEADEGGVWVYHGSADGVLAVPAWYKQGDQANARFGWSVGTAGDVNGDGYADVIVGAVGYTNGQAQEGRAWVWQGSASGLGATHVWSSEGNQVNAFFGVSVFTAGDVNGDGYSDIIVGASGYTNAPVNAGAAFVYYGSAASLDSAVVWIKGSDSLNAYFGWSVATAGDVNGDGYADIIVGAYGWDGGQPFEGGAWVYHGSATGPRTSGVDWYKYGGQANAWFGYAVGTAGDVNGDGYSDIIVGAPYWDHGDEDEGGAFIYHGSASGLSTTPALTKDSDRPGARFGWSVGTAGDVNGDGYSDIIVGAPYWDNGQATEGGAWVYLGSPDGLISAPAWHGEGNFVGGHYGWSVGTAGDVNRDGYSDIIVGSPDWSDDGSTLREGRAWVYLGRASGLFNLPAWHAEGNQLNAQMGYSVGTAGDVNGDGYSDVIVGAPFYDDEGRVWVFHGSASGLNATFSWARSGGFTGGRYGYAVATAGDVNGDGYADIIIGSPYMTGTVANEGTARVHLGSATGLQDTYAWRGEGGQTLSWYGNAVATAGDVNGDGYADVIVGSKDYNGSQTNEGRVYVYYGNASKGVSLRPRQTHADNLPLAQLGRANRIAMSLHYVQWTPFGRGRLSQDFEMRPFGVPFNGARTDWLGYYKDAVPGTETYVPFSHLAPQTLYHWRIRMRYHPVTTPFMPASRWFSAPWNGMNEADFRSGGARLLLPLILRP